MTSYVELKEKAEDLMRQVLTASDFRTDLAAASWERGDPVVNLVFECQA